MSFATTGAASGYASNNMSNAQTSAHVQVYHQSPNKSVYQNSNSRYTQSAQFYVVSDFDSNNGYLGQSVSWEYDRTADLGGTPFLLLTLPGLANVVYMDDDASSGAAACEIVHPDIFEHYRVALRAGLSNANDGPAGRVISEADPTFQWYATDGTGITDTNANFMHFYEGQPYWTPNVGYHCQNTATVKIGGTPIHIRAGMHQAAWAEVNAQPGKRLGAMVGGSDLGSVRLNKHLEFKRRSMRMQFLCVPLLVSFAHDPTVYLPLPAMQFHKIHIEYSLRAASKLICNGSQLPSGAGQYNSMGATSRVAAVLDGSISSDASLASPFDTASVMESSAATVYTITRYGEDTEANHKSKRGDMIALVNDTNWNLTSEAIVSGTAWDVANANCVARIGARLVYLQGAERAAMIQGGYDIPILTTQVKEQSHTDTAGATQDHSVDISSFTNSVEALYVLTKSSNAKGANHYNAGHTWDPLTEEYTRAGVQFALTINGNPAYKGMHPEFYNKLLPYINGAHVPTGDSHVYFMPFSMATADNASSVEVTGAASAASRWSTANVTRTTFDRMGATTIGPFSGPSTTRSTYTVVVADTYNALHVGQGVSGPVMALANQGSTTPAALSQ